MLDSTARAGPTRDLRDGIRDGLRRVTGRPADERITLKVWDWWSPSTTEAYAAYFGELERIFEARHPDVDVVFQAVPFGNYEQKLSTGMLGENPPDVFQSSVSWAQAFYRRGILRKLNDLVAATPELQDDQFMPATLYHSRVGEAIYGVPHIADASCLMWNLDLLKAEPTLHDMFERGPGGKPDFRRLRFEAVRDREHFRQITRALTRQTDQGKQFGFEINAYGMQAGAFMPWAAGDGVKFQDRAGTRALFDTPAAAEALRFVLDLYWKDRISPPFRRVLTTHEMFQAGKVACTMGGTWSGKYIIRNTQGWKSFGMTAFPPPKAGGPYKTLTWGNMMVISSRSRHPEIAWEYLKLVCSLEGALLRLKHLRQNSPRLDFYETPDWAEAVAEQPHLANVPRICAAGDPLNTTQVQAVGDEVQPIFEYMMFNWPEVQAGRGQYRQFSQFALDTGNLMAGTSPESAATAWQVRLRSMARPVLGSSLVPSQLDPVLKRIARRRRRSEGVPSGVDFPTLEEVCRKEWGRRLKRVHPSSCSSGSCTAGLSGDRPRPSSSPITKSSIVTVNDGVSAGFTPADPSNRGWT